MNDTDLITRAASGDETAQRVLYEAHHAAAFRLAYLLLGDGCDAEEVVQDVFAYLLRSLHRYDAERGTFWAWLRVTLVSRCRNKRRRRHLALLSLEGLEATGTALADPDPVSDPALVAEIRGVRRTVWETLQQVSPGARDALVLRYYEGLPYAEIAQALGCSPEAARARVAHGKAQLRRLLAGRGEKRERTAGATSAVEAS